MQAVNFQNKISTGTNLYPCTLRHEVNNLDEAVCYFLNELEIMFVIHGSSTTHDINGIIMIFLSEVRRFWAGILNLGH